MSESNSIINFGDVSKPITVLIEKISDAIGGIARPSQIRRIAKAEADAKLIGVKAQIEITDLQERGLKRMIYEEGQKQENIENITNKAISRLSQNAEPEKLERDWLINFFDKCRFTSDEEVQSLWAGVLAGEANSPTSFSKRSVNLLASIDKKDAELFTKLCTFCWMIGDLNALVIDHNDKIYESFGINFNSLTHLDNIGLITFSALAGFQRQKLPKHIKVFYYGKATTIEFSHDENNLNVGNVLLTQVGKELATICNSTLSNEYYSYIIDEWISKGYIIS